jgi:hypothetical protein
VQHTPTAFTSILASLSYVLGSGSSHAQQLPLGWRSLHPAGPDLHLLSETPKSPHRRLSLCSLPVPKQSVEGLGSLISFAQSATAGPGSLHSGIILMFFPSRESFTLPR